MKSEPKMRNSLFALFLCLSALSAAADSIPSMFSRPPEWRIGAEVVPAWVCPTDGFLKGNNPERKRIGANLAGDIRADFSFAPSTREGMLYPGLYQGLGLGMNTFFASSQLGSPASLYVYQGAPVCHIGQRFWLGYEWQFGAAFGWKHLCEPEPEYDAVVSTSVTARMGIALKLHYSLSDRWRMSFGIMARHYSNGNTSLPNSGVNTLGASVGIAYVIDPAEDAGAAPDPAIESEADSHTWLYDITAYGAWRKRGLYVGPNADPQICPGKFGVAGLQFSPMYRLNRWVAVGPGLDLQWDESAGLAPYWVDGSYGEDIRFRRPPFGKQLSVGLSAHAELTMPIFSVNVGLGYDVINPKGDKAFYQSLTLKTFVTRHIYINTGYRLGNFKDPQNLTLGLGFRL